ncbi:precorrin-6y C5,15-methyltransferase (decarboxylating) subunit CbiE [Devosia nitrariae]|uniref:Precorrin-6Y methyltransferase n=1 Tax=Devosia nitrariae TaxID=2071872 RepID=A0ABQ5W7N2_9HYPH|nr:precorrin-6y C5,15-methyltransferase (decarboxylating) subunit CbiE [Devosia nitrariae]GLQ55778.1 precorrin-6Y methyltransferase [Devosia nitrariae]
MRWLSVVGIGEDGVAGLGEHARAVIANAEIVFGGERHLGLADSLIAGERHAWLSPLTRSLEVLAAERGRRVCVLASGDPFLFGIGATLARTVPVEEMHVVPAPSAFSLAAARLGWPLQNVTTVSAHGRPIELILPHLQPGRHLLMLTSDEDGPAAIAQLLSANGFGPSSLILLEALGGPDERISQHHAEDFASATVNPLNLVAIEVAADSDARVLIRAPGLADDLFEHDGQITKREIRALTISSLAPKRGQLLWDIGAGAGSVAIEWMLADPAMRAIAVEADGERAMRIRRNALAFGAPDLEVVHGEAPQALADLSAPDAVFIGGGGSDPGVVEAAVAALKPGGVLVANAVTVEFEALLLARQAALGGSLTRVAIARADPVGTMTGWRPAMPVTQWVWVKGEAP